MSQFSVFFSDLPLVFQIFIPILIFLILVTVCVGSCKVCRECQAQSPPPARPSVFLIPAVSSLDGDPVWVQHNNAADHLSPPPSYSELEPKPDLCPMGPPPRYSVAIHSQEPAPSLPDT